jgi:hypothetical protein
MSYKILDIKKHLVLDADQGLWVLDTGAPTSFGSPETLEINEKTYEIQSNYMGFDNTKLSEALGENVEGLIGGDILNEYDSYWDFSTNRISFSLENLESEGIPISLEFFMGIPTLKVVLRGVSYNWFFDTGAVVSYVTEQLDEWETPVDQYDDFYPGYGNFSTEIFEDEITLETLILKIKCGVLPSLLGMSLGVGGCAGILGLGAINKRSFLYAPRRKKLVLNA